MSEYVESVTEVHPSVSLGPNCKIWAWSHIRENVVIGEDVTIGEHVYVGPGVKIGARSKIQNGSKIYDPSVIGEGVFIGPGVILTNDLYPRAVKPNHEKITSNDWKPVGVKVEKGASIGAGAICVAPVVIGEWSLVAAGSVVINDVLPFALVAGNPAKRINWVGRAGLPLKKVSENTYKCPIYDEEYFENIEGQLELK